MRNTRRGGWFSIKLLHAGFEREGGQRLCCSTYCRMSDGNLLRKGLQARQRTRQKIFRHAIEHDTTTHILIRQINPSSLSVHFERTRTRRGRTTYEIRAVGMEVNKKEVMISSYELGRKTSWFPSVSIYSGGVSFSCTVTKKEDNAPLHIQTLVNRATL